MTKTLLAFEQKISSRQHNKYFITDDGFIVVHTYRLVNNSTFLHLESPDVDILRYYKSLVYLRKHTVLSAETFDSLIGLAEVLNHPENREKLKQVKLQTFII